MLPIQAILETHSIAPDISSSSVSLFTQDSTTTLVCWVLPKINPLHECQLATFSSLLVSDCY